MHGMIPILGVALGASLALTSATAMAAPTPVPKTKVLVVTGGHDFEKESFLGVFRSIPDIEFVHAVHPDAHKHFAFEAAQKYDVVVLYDMWQDISDAARTDFVAMLQRGKGLVVLHHAMGNYQDWPEFEKIAGGKFQIQATPERPASTFDHDMDVDVKVADPKHPITAGLKDFRIHDETYGRFAVRPGVHVLLTTDHRKSGREIMWAQRYGNSRVVCLQLGHDSKAYTNPAFRRLVARSIRWTGGRLGTAEPDKDGFVSLFNGKDLDGWTVYGEPAGFVVRDGVIRSESGKGGGWLRSMRQYSDFILRVEWRTNPNGNSGVFLRAVPCPDPWVNGFEVQISNEPRDEAHCTGSLYGVAAVRPRPDESADRWHAFEIRCIGPRIEVFSDGVKVVDADAGKVEAMKTRGPAGYIGLQDSHNPGETFIEFRNIRIKDLSAPSPPED